MSPDTLFQICNNGVLPAWALLLIAPRWHWTQRLVHQLWIPALLALCYGYALVVAKPVSGASFFSLQGVMTLFQSPYAMLAGWIHYLAFDLFIGAWQVRDAQRRGIRHTWLWPCLLLTLMLGPLGLLLYLCLRFVLTKATTLVEQ